MQQSNTCKGHDTVGRSTDSKTVGYEFKSQQRLQLLF